MHVQSLHRVEVKHLKNAIQNSGADPLNSVLHTYTHQSLINNL